MFDSRCRASYRTSIEQDLRTDFLMILWNQLVDLISDSELPEAKRKLGYLLIQQFLDIIDDTRVLAGPQPPCHSLFRKFSKFSRCSEKTVFRIGISSELGCPRRSENSDICRINIFWTSLTMREGWPDRSPRAIRFFESFVNFLGVVKKPFSASAYLAS